MPTLSKRTFQVVALATLPLPFAATWFLAPSLPHPAASTEFAGPLRLLVIVFVLLLCVIAWALLLLPLRRRSDMPTMALGDVATLRDRYQSERANLQAMAVSDDPRKRRSYYLRLAAGGAVVALATGAASVAMFMGDAGVVYWRLPVVAAVSAVLAVWNGVRAMTTRGPA